MWLAAQVYSNTLYSEIGNLYVCQYEAVAQLQRQQFIFPSVCYSNFENNGIKKHVFCVCWFVWVTVLMR